MDAALHSALDHAVAMLPAVEPGWTMTNIQPDSRVWYDGTCEPAAMVEISVYGDILADCGAVTEQISAVLHEMLGIEKNRVYVKYSQAPYWGSGGINF